MNRVTISIVCIMTFCLSMTNAQNSVKRNTLNKCYGNCYKIGGTVIEYPIYIGEDIESEFIEETKVEIRPAYTKWEGRMPKGCVSQNPSDCLVLCLVEIPAEIIDITIVNDTIEIKDFVLEPITIEDIEQERIYERKEVLCESKINPVFMKSLRAALEDWGYEAGLTDRYKIGEKTQKALTQFQKDNDLPIGQLDFETLDLLGIEY